MLKKLHISIGLLVYLFIGLLALSLSNGFSPMVSADTSSLTVSTSVAPHTTDFPLTLTSSTTGTISQNTPITYTITYGSDLQYADHISLEAYWLQGTIAGANSPSVDGMEYVGGSAGSAYGTSPIVDLTNQKISWSISSFPANTNNQTVRFQLKTNANYTGTSSVTFPVKVRLIATNYTKPYEYITTTYLYDPTQVTPTPTPSSSTSSSTSSTAPTSAPQAIPTSPPTYQSGLATSKPTAPFQSLAQPTSNAPVQNVSIVNLSDSNAQLAVNLNKVKTATVVYGLSPTTLTGSSPISVSGTNGTINLDNLADGTTYYMQMVTTDASGKVNKSEIFSVQTAQTSATPQVANASLVVATDNNVLYSAGLNSQSNAPATTVNAPPQIPVAQDTNYTFAFKLTKANKIKSVLMTLTNTSVLGVSNFQIHPPQPLTYSFPVNQGDNGVYNVQIKNPTIAGIYDVYVRITDFDGNITTQKVASIRVLKPFRVYNATTHQPIEDARIVLYRLNSETKKYDLVPDFGGISNPLYTNKQGEASESLPKGQYKANFGSIGYKGQDNVKFSLGINPDSDFPTVYLTPSPVTPLSVFIYYRNAFTDYVGTTSQYIAAVQQSYRYFDLFGLAVIVCFFVITLLLFSIKSHIHFVHIPLYFHHHMLTLFHQDSGYIRGTIIDQTTKLPLLDATVFLIDEHANHVLNQTTSSTKGSFLFAQKDGHHQVSVLKAGYEPSGQIGYRPDIVIELQPGSAHTSLLQNFVVKPLEDGLALFFEFFLFLSLLVEIAFFPAFGLARTVPGLLLSVVNIFLWIFFLREKGKVLR